METEQNNLPVYEKVETLLQQESISPADAATLTGEEKKYLFTRVNDLLAARKGEEKEMLLKKIEPLMSPDFNNSVWEHNHINICNAISRLMNEYGRMPNKLEIARETGLSRKTIRKHLEEYKQSPQFAEQEEQFKMLKGNLLALLYSIAHSGDVKAIRLFFEATGVLATRYTVNKNIVENQHNYILINETRLSQEQIQRLSPERLKQVEELLKG